MLDNHPSNIIPGQQARYFRRCSRKMSYFHVLHSSLTILLTFWHTHGFFLANIKSKDLDFYIDDTFIIWPHGFNTLTTFLNHSWSVLTSVFSSPSFTKIFGFELSYLPRNDNFWTRKTPTTGITTVGYNLPLVFIFMRNSNQLNCPWIVLYFHNTPTSRNCQLQWIIHEIVMSEY